jgi:CBS domain-containing membrane protein
MLDNDWQLPEKEDFERALNEIGHVVDVRVSDLVELTERARRHAKLRERKKTRVGDAMSRFVKTIGPDTTLCDAADRMLHYRVSGLPVVDPNQRLIGLITEADLLAAIGLRCHHPTQTVWQTLEQMLSADRPGLHDPEEKVASIMTEQVISIRPEQTLHEVLETMKAHQIKRLVVVDDADLPVGMITRSDLVRAFFQTVMKTRERREMTDDAAKERE